jgi:hypothetical protein
MGGSLKETEIINCIKQIDPKYKNIKNFVETGTYKADSTIMASKHFENVYTIEIFEQLYEESKTRAKNEGITNITFYLGDSLDKLKEITPKVLDGAVFFIDAHISGHDSGWNGTTRVPIFEELDIILSNPDLGPSVFIVDDLRLWKTIKAWDWAHITNESIIQKFKDKNIKVSLQFENDDRFYVFTDV